MILVGALALCAAATKTAAAQAPGGQSLPGASNLSPPGQAPLFQAPAPEQETKNKWYGWQIIAVDVASIAASSEVGGLGIMFGSPLVHAANGEGGKAWRALALRTGLPLLGFIAGVAIFKGDCDDNDSYYDDDSCGFDALLAGVLGAGVGLLSAMVIDVAYLANKDVPVKRERPRYTLFDKYQPTVKFVDKGAAIGVRGTF